jgi:hypothetical protein
MEDSKRRLIWHGMFLFLLGLLTGFMETKFANPRMGLAAHLEGELGWRLLGHRCWCCGDCGAARKNKTLPRINTDERGSEKASL